MRTGRPSSEGVLMLDFRSWFIPPSGENEGKDILSSLTVFIVGYFVLCRLIATQGQNNTNTPNTSEEHLLLTIRLVTVQCTVSFVQLASEGHYQYRLQANLLGWFNDIPCIVP